MKLYALLFSWLLVTPLLASDNHKESTPLEKNEKPSNESAQKLMEVLELNLSQEGINSSESFVSDGRITVKFTLNAQQSGKVNVVWMHGDRIYVSIPINVKIASPKWHGHSNIRVFVGEWKVQLTDESGKILSEKGFSIASSNRNSASSDTSQTQDDKSAKSPQKIKEVLRTLEPEKTKKNSK